MAGCLDTPMYISLRSDCILEVAGDDPSAPLKVGHTSIAHLAVENAHLRKQVSMVQGNSCLAQENARLTSLRLVQQQDFLPPCRDCPTAGPASAVRQTFTSGGLDPTSARASRVSEEHLQPRRYAKTSSLNSRSSTATDRGSIASDSTAVISSADSNDASLCTPRSEQSAGSKATTVILRNIPNRYSRAALIALFEEEGFSGEYDMVYMPVDFATRAAFGYAFVNCVSSVAAERFLARFQGFSGWSSNSEKVCQATWSEEQGGLRLHVERYRNSPVMHESVPDEFRPVLFRDGERVPFPEPTKRLRRPRIIGSHKK